jgi:predicted MFS family arabinose efflux permease
VLCFVFGCARCGVRGSSVSVRLAATADPNWVVRRKLALLRLGHALGVLALGAYNPTRRRSKRVRGTRRYLQLSATSAGGSSFAQPIAELKRGVSTTCGDHLDLRTNTAQGDHRRGGRGFWAVAVAFATIQFGGAIPIPLYGLWRKQFPFGNGTLTVIFAIYVLGTLLALLLLAPLSDQIGRRPLMLFALVLAAVGTSIFLIAHSVAMLLVARFVSGLAAGITTATATAALHELQPEERAKFASLTATAMNTGGLGAGTLFAGIIGAYASNPTKLVFWIYLAILPLVFLGVIRASETIHRPDRVSWRPRGLSLPERGRGTFWLACAAAFAVFSQLGLYSSLVPSFLAGTLHEHNLAIAGAVSAGIFLVATATQLSFHRVSPSRAIVIGLLFLLVGLSLIELGLWTGVLGVLLAGTLFGGLAVGFTLMGAAATANILASPERRGRVLATFFCCAYAGISCPAVAVGIATDSVSVTSATLVCAIAIGGIALLTMIPVITGRARVESVP